MAGEIVQAWEDDSVLLPKVEAPKSTAVTEMGETVHSAYTIIRFRNRAMILENEPFPHFMPLRKEHFDSIAYPLLGGKTRSQMNDTFAYIGNVAEDLTHNERYILFGHADIDDETGEAKGTPTVWDMKELEIANHIPPMQCVWRSPITRVAQIPYEPIPWIMDLAGGEQDVYDDIMQSIAPMIMDKKPDGVIWWVGDGANGKSTLMDALYKIFPHQLASMNVKRLTDGRDTPGLNGTLANIVKESSEGRVDDTDIYKSIGTHENFRVHAFHKQDDIEVRGNMHHIFSANSIPAFNDKGHSAKRRTFIIPFREQFESDPDFERKTFTDEMLGRLVSEMCHYANRIKRQGYKYKWSAVTQGAKMDYDAEASNGEEYARQMMAKGLVAFENYSYVKTDYENWCSEMGYVPLGTGNLSKAMKSAGFKHLPWRPGGGDTRKHWRLETIEYSDLMPMGLNKPGFFTAPGFEPEVTPPAPEAQTKIVDVPPVEPDKNDIIKGRW